MSAEGRAAEARPRVAMVTSMGPPPYVGGIENVVDTVMQSELADRITFSLYDTWRDPDVRRSRAAKAGTLLGLATGFRRFLERERPDLVHIHFCSRADFWKHAVCLEIARHRGIASVFHLHGGSFDRFVDELSPPLRALLERILNRPDRLVALSSIWEEFLEAFVPSGKIRVLNNPIDCGRLAPAPRAPGDPPTFLLLGSLGRRKGHYDVLAALPKLLGAHPDVVMLFAGGDEDPDATKTLEREVHERGLGERVRFLGPIGMFSP